MFNSTRTKPYIIIIAVGALLATVFAYQLITVNNEVDTAAVGNIQQSAASVMTSIESRSGGTVDEAYYQAMGKFLGGEAKVNNATLRISVLNSAVTALAGMIISLGMVAYGIIAVRQAK